MRPAAPPEFREGSDATAPHWGVGGKQLLDLAQKYGRGYNDIRGSAELRPFIAQQVKLFLSDQQSLKDTQAALKTGYDAILQKDGYLPAK